MYNNGSRRRLLADILTVKADRTVRFFVAIFDQIFDQNVTKKRAKLEKMLKIVKKWLFLACPVCVRNQTVLSDFAPIWSNF